MKIEPGVSYDVKLHKEDEFLNNMVYRYIKYINEKAGYHFGRSLIGKYFIYDNKALPTDKYHVISFTERSERKLFTRIDLTKNHIEILLDVYNIENSDIVNYITKYMGKRKVQDIIPYLHLYKSSDMDFKSFKEAVKENIYGTPYYKHKVITVIKAISSGSPASVMALYDLIHEEINAGNSFESVVYFISHVISMPSIPDYISQEVSAYLHRDYYQKLVKVTINLTMVENVEDLLLNLLEK